MTIDAEVRSYTDRSAYVVVSTDTHASPSLERQLRPYCPSQYLDAFDSFVRDFREVQAGAAHPKNREKVGGTGSAAVLLSGAERVSISEEAKKAEDASLDCSGLKEHDGSVADMNRDGVAADIIFSGAPNGEVLPWLALGFDQGPRACPWSCGASVPTSGTNGSWTSFPARPSATSG